MQQPAEAIESAALTRMPIDSSVKFNHTGNSPTRSDSQLKARVQGMAAKTKNIADSGSSLGSMITTATANRPNAR